MRELKFRSNSEVVRRGMNRGMLGGDKGRGIRFLRERTIIVKGMHHYEDNEGPGRDVLGSYVELCMSIYSVLALSYTRIVSTHTLDLRTIQNASSRTPIRHC